MPPTGPGSSPLARVVARLAGAVTRSEPPRVFTAIGRHPRLFRRWLPFAGTLLLHSALPRDDVELVILRTAWRCNSWYEWVQHIPFAARAGLGPETIARLPAGPEADGWTARQRLLLLAADELHEHLVISDPTWRDLATMLSEKQLIELTFLVGHYEMLAMALNSLGVEAEPTALARLSGSAADTARRLRSALARQRSAER